ncbi:hypothetical protein AB0H65_31430 [Streptomyces griseoaurantiacus]|uniref:hypothetical protein n=1 Tax=Streptomyces griseoaurantiacus TaxID=68213 RepID=UPI0034616602
MPAALLAELAEAAQAEGARLHLPDQRATDRVLRSTWEAESRNGSDSGRAAESRRWADGPRSSPGFGLGPAAAGPQDALDRLPMRDFGAHRRPSAPPALPCETHSALVLLRTAHDRRADWLRAGQALERVLLVATAGGVRASLLHQALEWTDLRGDLDRVPDGDYRGHTQMVIRLGYGPEGPVSPRRGAAEVIDLGG